MNKYIFYHVFLCDKINNIISEQLTKLENSGLLKESELYVNIIDVYHDEFSINEQNNNIIEKYAKKIFADNYNYYEMLTLHRLHEHALNHKGYYLYMHTKGCTRVNDESRENYSYKNIENWRHIIEHFNIENWKICEKYLNEGYDLVGCNYNGDWGTPHYSGNFWWANSNFIKKLPDPTSIPFGRMDGEMWISKIKHKALCLYPLPKENANRGYIYTPKEEYFNNIIKTEFNK
jgi:hypothetical protein